MSKQSKSKPGPAEPAKKKGGRGLFGRERRQRRKGPAENKASGPAENKQGDD